MTFVICLGFPLYLVGQNPVFLDPLSNSIRCVDDLGIVLVDLYVVV